MIYTVTLNPALDKTVEIDGFSPNCVNRVKSLRTDPGGKGINVSKVIYALGGGSVPVGILAGASGQEIAQALAFLPSHFTFVPGQTRTNLKIVDKQRGTNTDINESGDPVAPETLEELKTYLLSRLTPEDIVVLSGSVPPGTDENIYKQWCADFSRTGAKVFLDADGSLFRNGIEGVPYLIKPNKEELQRLTGKTLETQAELIHAGRTLQQLGIQWVVISLGGDGALFLCGKDVYLAEALSVPVSSTVGAGDSMVAALAYGMTQKLPTEQILALCIATSAANVMCCGTQSPEKQLIDSLLPQVKLTKL